MLNRVKRHKKLIVTLSLLLLSGALVWAAAKLSGQANALAQDSGAYAAEMESLTISAIRKPAQTKASPGTPPPCDWQEEVRLRNAIEQNDAEYKTLVAQAKAEQSRSGAVTEATEAEVTRLAAEYKSLCDQYADMWSACNCGTRARAAKAAGESRVRSAVVAVSDEIDGDLLKAMGVVQKEMRKARAEYAVEAVEGAEIAAADKEDLRANVVPAAKSLVDQLKGFSSAVQNLILQIRNNPTGGGQSSGGGEGGGSGGGRGGIDPVSQMNVETRQLYRDTQTLGGESRELYNNSRSLHEDVAYLAGGPKPGYLSMIGGMVPCFVESVEAD